MKHFISKQTILCCRAIDHKTSWLEDTMLLSRLPLGKPGFVCLFFLTENYSMKNVCVLKCWLCQKATFPRCRFACLALSKKCP